jgi:hypothetical protein
MVQPVCSTPCFALMNYSLLKLVTDTAEPKILPQLLTVKSRTYISLLGRELCFSLVPEVANLHQ